MRSPRSGRPAPDPRLRRVVPLPPTRRRGFAAELAALAVAAGLPDARRAALHLAVHEALCNAVEHGHRGDEGRAVSVSVVRVGPRWRCTVGDQAVGGAWAGPTDGGGHGWSLMRAGADAVTVWSTSTGTRVRLEVELGGPSPGRPQPER